MHVSGFFLYNKSSALIIHNPRSEITERKIRKKYELNENKNPRNRHTILSYSTEV